MWVWIWKEIRTTDIFQDSAPHPTEKPWDYFFSKRESCWVVVTLKDGSKVGGNYDSKSFSSSAPAEEQLYLEESWLINDDGGLERPREETKGIIILFSEMVHIELFNKQ